MQIASTVLMVRPAAFGFNAETAANNTFQTNDTSLSPEKIQQLAVQEFDNMADKLRQHGIDVIVIEDTAEPVKPDAIFPNNWLSSSPEGSLAVYPMFAPVRRKENRDDIVKKITDEYIVNNFQDWTEFEAEGRFLEGTGSMIIDHENKIIYACLSERTSIVLLEKYAAKNGYQAITFVAKDQGGNYIYHTNVMMALGQGFAVLCNDSIEEEWERIAVRQLLESSGHDEIINLNFEQLHSFAGNMLQLKNNKGENIFVMSRSAFDSLDEFQKEDIERYTKLMPIAIPTIEKYSGGSVRCMMAEIFLEKKK